MKKIFCHTLSAIIVFCVITLPSTLALSNTESRNDDILMRRAAEIITVSNPAEEAAPQQTTYSNLDNFVAVVQSEYPHISDYDLATFILSYTHQYFDEGTDSAFLQEVLTFSESITSTELLQVTEDSINKISELPNYSLLADWPSPDGYLKITTASNLQTINGLKRYLVSANAVWLKHPAQMSEDVFVLATTGVIDDSYNDYGAIFEDYNCTTHSKFVYRAEAVNSNNLYGNGIQLEYSGGSPGVRFSLFGAPNLCDEDPPVHHVNPFTISASVRYRVIPPTQSTVCQAQASYSHKQTGIKITWSLSTGGLSPSFSLVGTKNDYFARPISMQ